MKNLKILLTLFIGLFIYTTAGAQHRYVVNIVDFQFQPPALTINQGDTVVWVNMNTTQHTTTSGSQCTGDAIWDSGLLDQNQTFMHIFTYPDNYPYFCTIHCSLGMTGNITVNPIGTGLVSVPDDYQPVEILGIVPNPFRDYARIEYLVNEPSQISVRILNAAGEQKMLAPDLNPDLGEHQESISTANLESGIYFVYVLVNNGVASVQRMIKM